MFRFIRTLFLLDSVTSVDRIQTQGEYYSATRHRILRHEFFLIQERPEYVSRFLQLTAQKKLNVVLKPLLMLGKRKE